MLIDNPHAAWAIMCLGLFGVLMICVGIYGLAEAWDNYRTGYRFRRSRSGHRRIRRTPRA